MLLELKVFLTILLAASIGFCTTNTVAKKKKKKRTYKSAKVERKPIPGSPIVKTFNESYMVEPDGSWHWVPSPTPTPTPPAKSIF